MTDPNMYIGKDVYLVRGYKDPCRCETIIVREVGTFYIDRLPPQNLMDKAIKGKIETRLRGASYPFYRLSMNFNNNELKAAPVIRAEAKDLIAGYDKGSDIPFPTVEEALDAYKILEYNKISCELRGNVIHTYYGVRKAKEVLEEANQLRNKKKPKRRLFHRVRPQEDTNNEDEFEI